MELRNARPEDMMVLFRWANDPDVRKNSFSTKEIGLAEHKNWFAGKLASFDSRILIGWQDNDPVGVVRFERSGKQAVVGINLDKQWRGKGLGGKLLEMGIVDVKTEKFVDKITAYIKSFNDASVKMFLKAGFKEIENTELSQYQDSRKFVLE
ncbi:MAG: hypothetical protein A2268_15150 [Candidatus Raymondbacteria bacterium RifOxyA12_full_50_37]|nr:MAG: hypothetical protein A2268_15150 [Candidatus Raymondbacteria bacterium RifOxyA12_full_50_37]OGJ88506.1 MAG: hypothetical protein A2248_20110 [Candidatus Raymondbacteria bacterium RIFOXYA2_FULL_49_16]OGJ90611.1 MAG: hypothetical protein A2350_18400 [Candidatus Raymondbacteria bacterium RifOxyB12_full_50_8]OGJ98967.1 MAG: hypothetical protein A2453_10830 [Candidatus Raymondbacteria bacterium RIFOXYC2_FULL_50_21]OGP41477.1 MAG: hypothetical protein A2324_05640 [Candidatus Raymondbacteria b